MGNSELHAEMGSGLNAKILEIPSSFAEPGNGNLAIEMRGIGIQLIPISRGVSHQSPEILPALL